MKLTEPNTLLKAGEWNDVESKEARTERGCEVNKLLHKSTLPTVRLVQWTSDQVVTKFDPITGQLGQWTGDQADTTEDKHGKA